MIEPGRVIRERRAAYGLTQSQLAIRAGTTQAAISRIERGEVSPSVMTLERLLYVMGEEATLRIARMEGDFDRRRVADLRARPAAERAELAMAWNRFASEVAQAGARARVAKR